MERPCYDEAVGSSRPDRLNNSAEVDQESGYRGINFFSSGVVPNISINFTCLLCFVFQNYDLGIFYARKLFSLAFFFFFLDTNLSHLQNILFMCQRERGSFFFLCVFFFPSARKVLL